MQRPWKLPAYPEPGHAVPLGAGRWRGPQPGSETCSARLEDAGLFQIGTLADGTAAWRLDEAALRASAAGATPLADGALDDPAWRAEWIAARVASALAAWREPTPMPRVLGILNLTPDSFSDGGALFGADATVDLGALRAASARLEQEDADALDLGAESTRPGAAPVDAATQLARLLPALDALRDGPLPLSVDTRSAVVAEACLDAGATWINDVSGLGDPSMAALLARRDAPAFLMHMRGTPADMREHARYRHLIGEVADELAAIAGRGLAAGMKPQRIVLDPGIGFAKDAAQSAELVAHCGALRALGFPLLLGPSRKSFLGADGGPEVRHRDGATAGAAALCAAQGVAWLRLHRGGPVRDAIRAAHACAAATREEVCA